MLLSTLRLSAQPFEEGPVLSVDLSASSTADVERAGSRTSTSVWYQGLRYSHGFKLTPELSFTGGLAYGRADFSGDHLLFPDTLTELSLPLGFRYRIDERWGALLQLNPGFSQAGSSLESEGFSVPLVLGGSYARDRNLVWLFGLSWRELSEYPLLPYVGALWNFAPRWSLNLGFPRTGISYALSDAMKLTASVSGEGGSYYVKRHETWIPGTPGAPAYQPNLLGDVLLDYRELRFGLGFEWKFGSLSRLSFEGGLVADRKWDYHQHDIRYDGEASSFARLSVVMRF